MRQASVLLCALLTAMAGPSAAAMAVEQTKGNFVDKFRQLDEVLPTANVYRTAGGEPGHEYWQQEADYEIDVRLDEDARRIIGSEEITYTNNAPDSLRWLWLQLDQNRFREDSIGNRTRTFGDEEKMSFGRLRLEQLTRDFDGGHVIDSVTDARGRDLPYTIVGTLMRVDLPEPLAPGKSVTFNIDWSYNIPLSDGVGARAGYEYFADDGNDIFLLAQWFPRMVVYSDYEGWHNKEFIGSGEFTLEFGDYEVAITVPEDHIVASTGVLQNASDVLTRTQRQRLDEARDADRPVFVVTQDEALENEAERSGGSKTWRFSADNVRDFAWASSRKFIWDAQGYEQDSDDVPFVMAMSFYPKEGEPLWSRYSTQAVIHTMEEYTKMSFDYPYPTAQSVNGPVGGMEYPMITFNGPRTEPSEEGDRTYSRGEKRFLIGVVIHEIGHIYFPMTVNSDERQWTFMDEGVNTFLQFIAEQAWEEDYPSRRGEPRWMTDYMKSERQVPIMTNSESVLQLGNNAYGKTATALNVLRETILGRELFDFAFREYSRRWMFKRPTPADLFRTLEEASGVDLDWFWRGWFYTTDHVDISIDKITHMKVDTQDPDVEKALQRQEYLDEPVSRTDQRNAAAGEPTRMERMPDLEDFYNEYDQFTVSPKDRDGYEKWVEGLEDENASNPMWMKEVWDKALEEDLNYYVMEFSNHGGLVMPIILGITYVDGSTEEVYLPAEIWRRSPHQVNKLLVREGEIAEVVVDPHWETADVDISNNHYPRKIIPSRIEIYKREGSGRNLMEDMRFKPKAKEGDVEAGAEVPMTSGR